MSRELEEEGGEALGKPPIVHNPCRRPQTGVGCVFVCVRVGATHTHAFLYATKKSNTDELSR